MPTTTYTVRVTGIDPVAVTVTDYGTGQPFLLLHGGAGPQSMTAFAELLADFHDAHVLVPVHPGFGGTYRPAGLASVPALARLYNGLIEQLGLDDVTVIGNSLGGWTAAEIALLRSPRVSGIVLIDAVGIDVPGHPVADFFAMTMEEVFTRAFHNPEPFRVDLASLPPEARAIAAGNSAAQAAYAGPGGSMSDPGLACRLATLETPTLVLWGDSDRIADPGYGRAYAAAIPMASFRLLGDTGHQPQMETPGLVLDAIWDDVSYTAVKHQPRVSGKDRSPRPVTAVTRVTHSCHLIEIGGRVILTDPWFGTKPGYYQGEPIAMDVAGLPDLDAVLISHDHYDHCDLDTFAAYRDRSVPLLVPATVAGLARAHGFENVTVLQPWQQANIGDVTVTAAPALHGVYEITFVLQSGADAVYFAGDTRFIPELREIPWRLGHISIALLPTNGLRLRFADDRQVVMDADEAAKLTAVLKPELAIPHHYAFTSGWLGDCTVTSSDSDPVHYQQAAKNVAPGTTVRIIEPGIRVEL
jgi:L-ascorbate metabolism protein UlaG (beta-lactamase superfamily)/pimeloyl-ACP methyl ester carboxylesterase